MKKTTLFLSTFILTVLSFADISAQTSFEVPPDVQLNVREDYAKYEPDIIAASKWLETNDLGKEEAKRKEVSAFVLKWIIGSPTVNISMGEHLLKVYDKNASLLIIYMGSYTRYYLENKATATPYLATKAALISMMTVYKKGIDISRSKEMERLIKATDENKLDEYIVDKMKVAQN